VRISFVADYTGNRSTTVENHHTPLFDNVITTLRSRTMELNNVIFLEIVVDHQDAGHPALIGVFETNGSEKWKKLARLELWIRGKYVACHKKDKYHKIACKMVKMIEKVLGKTSTSCEKGEEAVCNNLPYPFWSAAKGFTLAAAKQKQDDSTQLVLADG